MYADRKNIFEFFKSKMELLLGWLEIVFKSNNDYKYKYVMERIELEELQEKLQSTVYYKLVGCRKLQQMSAVELNKSVLFTLFRPDHAQMIVSIATAEILMSTPIAEMNEKFKSYVAHCNFKLNGKINACIFSNDICCI